jgi:putative spermidine/putrescine transport system permease protein
MAAQPITSGYAVQPAGLALPRRGWKLGSAAWLLLPLLAFMILFFVLPLSSLVLNSVYVTEPGGVARLSLEHYIAFLTEEHYLKAIWTSLKVAFLATLVCLVIGYPLAYLMARSGSRAQIILLVIVFSPLFVGVVVRAFAWTVLLRSDGIINNALIWLGLIDAPMRLLFTETGLVIALVHVFLPLMVLPLASVIQRIDPALDEAAATLGAGGLRRTMKILLPLSIPGISAGCTMVFCMSISAYVIPTLVAGGRILTMPTQVARYFTITLDWSMGAAVAVILVLITTGVVIANVMLVERRGMKEAKS